MKKMMWLIAVLLSSLTCLAQNISHSTEYGFSFSTNVAGSWTWTNDTAYPFRFSDIVFNSAFANTTTVERVHIYKLNQLVGNVVTTNDMGGIETNFYYQVTNTLMTYATNVLLSTTNSGAGAYTSEDIKQLWINFGDIVRFSFSDTSTNLLYFNTTR